MKQKVNVKKGMIAVVLTLCMTVGLLFTGYGNIATKAEEADAASHTLQNPSKDAEGNVTWDCVWFGSYPQTEIVSEEDEAQLTAMKQMNANYETKYETVSAADYQQIADASYNENGDATVDGVKYRRMKQEDATHASATSGRYQWTDAVSYHYFRYEPIKWRVLSVEGDDAFLLADTGLDDRKYNDSAAEITWETSTMRSWLNGYEAANNQDGNDYSSNNFLDSAFSDAEQAVIPDSMVVNADNSECDTEGGNNTTDKVFLLSIDEALQEDYGFATDANTENKARRAKTSTYAKAMGCYSESTAECAGCVIWWLRSSDNNTDAAACVMRTGKVGQGGLIVTYMNGAVRPALHLNLSSSSPCSYAGTVSSAGTTTEETLGNVPCKGSSEESSTATTTQEVTTTETATTTQEVTTTTTQAATTTAAQATTTTTQAATTTAAQATTTTTQAATTTAAQATTTTTQTATTTTVQATTTTTQPTATTKVSENTSSVTAPAKVTGLKLKKTLFGSGKLKVSFKKVKQAKGYQLSYSTNKRFSKAKKLTIKKNKYTINKLKKRKDLLCKGKGI